MRILIILVVISVANSLKAQNDKILVSYYNLKHSTSQSILVKATIGDSTFTAENGTEVGKFITRNGKGAKILDFVLVDFHRNPKFIQFEEQMSKGAVEIFIPLLASQLVSLQPTIENVNIQWDCCQYIWPKGDALRKVKKKDRQKIQNEINSTNATIKEHTLKKIKELVPNLNTNKINISVSRKG